MKRFSSTSVFNDRGFTLLEILMAITILAFMTIGVISITQNSADTMERTTEVNKNNLQIETALSRFEWDFSQIYSPLYFSTVLNFGAQDLDGDGLDDNSRRPMNQAAQANPVLQEYYQRLVQRFEQNEHFSAVSKEGLPIPRFYSPEKNVFEFFTTSNRRKIENTKQSHFAWVRYSLGDPIKRENEEPIPNLPPSLKTLVRYYTADDPYYEKRIDIEDVERVKAAVLLENVESLEFQFWDLQRRKWETNLRTIAGGENILRGVKVLITWYDSTGNKRTVERIYRNPWPLEVPQDMPAQNPGTTTGTTNGTANGGNPNGGDDPDDT